MDKMSRRNFLKIVGGGTAMLAGGVMLSGFGLPSQAGTDALTFRAVAGLPTKPLPSYASYVLEGGVNVATKSGVLTKTVFAGPPDAMSNLALPGLTRVIRVTDVRELGKSVEIVGQVADPSQLLQGESSTVTVRVDKAAGTAQTLFLGNEINLQLA